MKHPIANKGFTLVELMIVIAVVAILIALAIPSYTAYVRKANRGDAQQLLMNWANNQEIWRASNTTYAGTADIAAPTHDKYTFTISSISPTTYTLTATPKSGQDKDKDKGESCNPLTLNQSGTKGPQVSGVTYCWGN